MKSKDENYFQGFPAAWNVVTLCLYIISPTPWLTLAHRYRPGTVDRCPR